MYLSFFEKIIQNSTKFIITSFDTFLFYIYVSKLLIRTIIYWYKRKTTEFNIFMSNFEKEKGLAPSPLF